MKRAGWDGWFASLPSVGEVHGFTLVNAMIDAAAGRYFVGPSDADDALNAAEREGLIVRVTYAPTISQRAFAGLSERRVDERTRRFYASRWTWRRA
jgi:hypothetical protein